jgi:hypothetical protein
LRDRNGSGKPHGQVFPEDIAIKMIAECANFDWATGIFYIKKTAPKGGCYAVPMTTVYSVM